MEPDIRGQKLLEIITHGLARYASRNTLTQLGNREEYVGMSDLGSYMACPRMAVLNKLHSLNTTYALKPLLTMQRGHWFEDGIADALKTLELPLVRQLEIAVTHNGTPIKAHRLHPSKAYSTDTRSKKLPETPGLPLRIL